MGDHSGAVDAAWSDFECNRDTFLLALRERILLKVMEQQAYAIAGGVFGHPRPDVVNESLTRAWRSLGKFRGESRFSTWFHRIVLNVCKAHGAKETLQKKREVPLSDAAVSTLYYHGIRYDVLTKILTLEEYDFLCDKLVPLHDAEVATKWGLSLSGVRGRWRRIKKKIQAALE